MKKNLLSISGLVGALLLISSLTYSQGGSQIRSYVVVGAFKYERNAESYANRLKQMGVDGAHRFNTYRQLFYVFVYSSDNREAAKQSLFSLRANHPNLEESWLYTGDFNGPHIPEEELNEVTDEDMISAAEETEVNKAESITEEPASNQKEEPKQVIEDEEPHWKVYINTVNAASLKEVEGKFSLYDAERNQKIRDLETHELLKIKDPDNRTNRVRFVSEIFGYHEIETTIDLDEPLATDTTSLIEMVGDTIVLNFRMQRIKKGDIMTLWKVYFYVDAAIMKEESIYELNQLLDLMQENPNIKIMIHGHTNGNSFGPVLHLDLDDKQFFSLNGSHEETMASAKKLSLYRAYTIQHWLIAQGIAEERMEIKGWGGKKMIYDKHDTQADKNVRVEIEILED